MADPSPDVEIPRPWKITCEIPPMFLYSEAEVQREEATPRTLPSGFSTTPPVKTSTLLEARNRARTTSAHTAVVLDEHFEIIVGGVGTPESGAFCNRGWTGIKSAIFRERYGPSSFFVVWVSGLLSTMDLQYFVNLWALEARYHEIPPPDVEETSEQMSTRLANKRAYEDASRELQARWKATYNGAFHTAIYEVSRTNGHMQRMWSRKREFYQTLRDSPPQPEIDTGNLTTRAEIISAKPIRFSILTETARLAILRDHITRDVIASVLEASRAAVDIRRLCVANANTNNNAAPGLPLVPAPAPAGSQNASGAQNVDVGASILAMLAQAYPQIQFPAYVPPAPALPVRVKPDFSSMWTNTLAHIANILDDRKLRPEDICDIHTSLGYHDEALHGSWQDVPIFHVPNQRFKRRLHDMLSEPVSPDHIVMEPCRE